MLELLDLHFTDDVLADLQVVMECVQAPPQNAALQAQIEQVEHQLARLRELYVLGDFIRDPHMAARAGQKAELAKSEQELGGADYSLGGVIARINRMGEILQWAQPLFADLPMVGSDNKCPQGTSSPCSHPCRARHL